jgi:hypothetical protein
VTSPVPDADGLPTFGTYVADMPAPLPESWTITRGTRPVTVRVDYTSSTIGPVATVTRAALHDLLRLAGFTGPAPVEVSDGTE